jgi:proteasome lid subunit RPN8/RPN11
MSLAAISVKDYNKNTFTPELYTMVTHLSDLAYTGMVLAALESFSKECYGLLLGQRTRDALVVQYAIPYQTADRHSSWVQRNESAHRRMEKFLSNLTHLDLIGDFHSHTQRGDHRAMCRLSREDRDSMSPNEVCIILAVSHRHNYQPWRLNRDGSLSGTIEDHFIKLGAWYRGNNSDQQRTPLRCPLAIGLTWK